MNYGLSHEQTCKLKYLINKGNSVNAISLKLGLDKELLTRFLFDSNFNIIDDKIFKRNDIDIDIKEYSFTKDLVNILVLADTHLGHNNDRIDLLKRVYGEAIDREADIIVHLGDLTNGLNKETKFKSIESLKNYCIRYYPYSEVETFILSGNHDCYNNYETDIVDEITNIRNDLTYIGNKPLILKVNNIRFLLAHGDNKSVYRKLMKETNANVLMYGHEHHSALINNKNYVELKVPSLLDDGRKKMGVWWLTMHEDNSIDYELQSFPKRVLKK